MIKNKGRQPFPLKNKHTAVNKSIIKKISIIWVNSILVKRGIGVIIVIYMI